MQNLTKRQHYVPDFYIRQWVNEKDKVTVHDILAKKIFLSDPSNILVQKFFYEEDASNPDNRIENILASMESRCSVTFKKLKEIGEKASIKADKRDVVRYVTSSLSHEDVTNIIDFAAYQYLRVPGAIDQKEYETQISGIEESARLKALNPGRFVESGYEYVKAKFHSLNVLILVSPGTEFITSDWPCFDLKDSNSAPLLGEDIGTDPGVVCYMPLTPLLGVVFTSPEFSESAKKAPRLLATKVRDVEVRNQNSLIIQQAETRVIARKEEAYISKIADKRKKSTWKK